MKNLAEKNSIINSEDMQIPLLKIAQLVKKLHFLCKKKWCTLELRNIVSSPTNNPVTVCLVTIACLHHFLITSLLFGGTIYSKCILYFPCPTPGISHFSQDENYPYRATKSREKLKQYTAS